MRANYFTTFYFAGRELAISQLQNLASNFIDKLLVLNIFISDIISKTVQKLQVLQFYIAQTIYGDADCKRKPEN